MIPARQFTQQCHKIVNFAIYLVYIYFFLPQQTLTEREFSFVGDSLISSIFYRLETLWITQVQQFSKFSLNFATHFFFSSFAQKVLFTQAFVFIKYFRNFHFHYLEIKKNSFEWENSQGFHVSKKNSILFECLLGIFPMPKNHLSGECWADGWGDENWIEQPVCLKGAIYTLYCLQSLEMPRNLWFLWNWY